MKNRKQLLADFYLELLAIDPDNMFRARNQALYGAIREALVFELDSDDETIQTLFERMAEEDIKV